MRLLHALELVFVLLCWPKHFLRQHIIVDYLGLFFLAIVRFDCFYFMTAQESVGLFQNCVEFTYFHFSFLVEVICIYLPVNVFPLVFELVLCWLGYLGGSNRFSRVSFVICFLRYNARAFVRNCVIIFRLQLFRRNHIPYLRLCVIQWIPMSLFWKHVFMLPGCALFGIRFQILVALNSVCEKIITFWRLHLFHRIAMG